MSDLIHSEPMKLKSYFSGTVEAAMELARQELGEDAFLVNARPSTPETRYLGAYEVVFGLYRQAAPPALPATAVFPRIERRESTVDKMTEDLAQLQQQIQKLSTKPAAESAPLPRTMRNLAVSKEKRPENPNLTAAELDPALIHQVEQGTPLADLFTTDAAIGKSGARRAVMMLVGPPGAGKTSTLAKIAARYGVAANKRTHLLTADVYRIAAADQLRGLAAILGIGCGVVETPAALANALEEHAGKELILIDAPGLSHAELQEDGGLAQMAASHPEIDTHLVLPASMRAADLARVVDDYAVFAPSKLLFTRLDETQCHGALINEAARRNLPISFLCAGQQIPDDIEPATRRRVVELVLGAAGVTAPRSMGAAA